MQIYSGQEKQSRNTELHQEGKRVMLTPFKSTAILCVDDNPHVTKALYTLFRRTFQDIEIIETAHSAEEAQRIVDQFLYDKVDLQVVISDYIMPGVKGDELLEEIHQKLPKAKKILLTAKDDTIGVEYAVNQAHLYRFLGKPWIDDDMILTVRSAIVAYQQETLLEHQNRELIKLNLELERKVKQRTRALVEKNRELEQIATIDRLTGVFNRRKLDEVLYTEVLRSKRYGNTFGVILLDIDHFKSVNDTFGHLVGDRVLQLFASQLKNSVRDVDVLGRWGGEEFLIICPETAEDGILLLARILRRKVQGETIAEVGVKTASFGVTAYCKGDSVDNIIKRADKALYLAKQNGRNRVEFCFVE